MNNTDETISKETPKRHDALRKAGQCIWYLSILLTLITGGMSFSMMLNMPAEGNMRLLGMVIFLSNIIVYPVAGYAIKHLFSAIADIAENSFMKQNQ